ncbi:hypothetical protein HUJ04_001501 [Dendroctonus ponderosae]|nr:hypothetical protein HUJ04_001501 [Dendroctonus ponderosae]KAH1017040.1 hypothetical protein HUJ05_007769 [Dendroctonus ponderosae]
MTEVDNNSIKQETLNMNYTIFQCFFHLRQKCIKIRDENICRFNFKFPVSQQHQLSIEDSLSHSKCVRLLRIRLQRIGLESAQRNLSWKEPYYLKTRGQNTDLVGTLPIFLNLQISRVHFPGVRAPSHLVSAQLSGPTHIDRCRNSIGRISDRKSCVSFVKCVLWLSITIPWSDNSQNTSGAKKY